MKEQHLEQQLVKTVEDLGGVCWKLVSPGTTGVPDRIVLLPDGHVGFVEVKAPGGNVRAIQKHRLRQLKYLGFTALVLNNPDEVEEVCHAISAA
ncbi:VRR-NUC domain-containing protein [Actinotignum sanguinis]|uniref:VRR-NUC domain-containing protein n=1 Tax=Actinotignum sanguinis TaxID=1445614 RepID=UPI00254F6113|nr:VRR-NUC domain-containing protein [Actinotignum sanguinis]MDK8352349.1 VRR-NUC domain-containing protein [Actinotignum sanguinis]